MALALVDLMMPQIDGLEFSRRVRESEQEHHVPILMLTGSVDAADRRAGFALGADDYLLKPFRNQMVIERVRAWTHTAESAQPQGGDSCRPNLPRPIRRRIGASARSSRSLPSCWSSMMIPLFVTCSASCCAQKGIASGQDPKMRQRCETGASLAPLPTSLLSS